jgi:ABC-type spermidine/putrescine transport system permease subunit II
LARTLRDMDPSLEEAARDLGAGPVRVLFDVTLPVIAPALVAGWLLAFTLSLDEVVVVAAAAANSLLVLLLRQRDARVALARRDQCEGMDGL